MDGDRASAVKSHTQTSDCEAASDAAIPGTENGVAVPGTGGIKHLRSHAAW